MGVFANAPKEKFNSLPQEEKDKILAWRSQENDKEIQKQNAGNYSDVIGREENKAVDSPAGVIRATSGRKSTKS